MCLKFIPQIAPSKVGGMNTVATTENQRALVFWRSPMKPVTD